MAIAPNEGALGSEAFGRFYYLTDYGEVYERNDQWLSFFSNVAARLVDMLAPTSVLDAGCALGLLVESFVRHGVDATGVDVSEWAIANVDASIADRVSVASLTEPLAGRYDLVTCLEVLEHLRPDDGEQAIANLCAVTDRVVFASTPSHYGETTHLNVQPIEWWAERFASHGFLRNPDLNVTFIAPWAVVFDRAPGSRREIVRRYERELGRLRAERTDVRAALLRSRQQLDAIMAAAAAVDPDAAADPATVIQRLAGETTSRRESTERLQAELSAAVAGLRLKEQQVADALARAEVMEARALQQAATAQRREELLADALRQVAELEAVRADRAELGRLEDELAAALARLRALEEERAHLLAAARHRDELLESMSWRIGRAVVGPVGRVRRMLGGPPSSW